MGCKYSMQKLSTKFLQQFLLILWGVQRIVRYLNFGLALVTLVVQTIATPQNKGNNAEHLQVKQKS
jgi:hypothetical protein